MKLRVLGCSGGVGPGLRTTSFLVDKDILIDVGSGVGDLTQTEQEAIRHIFITHTHMDHCAFLPFLADNLFGALEQPLLIHGQPRTVEALKTHLFNWIMWPDFCDLPSREHPVMRFEEMLPGSTLDLAGNRQIEMIEVNHIVPGVGYRVQSDTGTFAFTGDTTNHDNFWNALNAHEELDLLICEVAFPNSLEDLARRAGHYSPRLLAEDLAKLRHAPEIRLSHPKPGQEKAIINECREAIPERSMRLLHHSEEFFF